MITAPHNIFEERNVIKAGLNHHQYRNEMEQEFTVLCQTISKPHSQNSATNSMIMKDGIGTSTECPSEVVYLLENSFIHLEEAKRLF